MEGQNYEDARKGEGGEEGGGVEGTMDVWVSTLKEAVQ